MNLEELRKGFSLSAAPEHPGGELLPEIASWPELKRIGRCRVTSQDCRYPIESVFEKGGEGWRAVKRGKQAITIFFDKPLRIRRIWLQFIELEAERTQKITLEWSKEKVNALQPLFEQWWSFSPGGSTRLVLDYEVDLNSAQVLQLVIDPDISRGQAVASLASLRLA